MSHCQRTPQETQIRHDLPTLSANKKNVSTLTKTRTCLIDLWKPFSTGRCLVCILLFPGVRYSVLQSLTWLHMMSSMKSSILQRCRQGEKSICDLCWTPHYLVSLYGTYNDIVNTMYILKNERQHGDTLGEYPKFVPPCTYYIMGYTGHTGVVLPQGYSHFSLKETLP